MENPTIRLHYIDDKGVITHGERDFDLSDFAGFLPAIGDMILHPGVLQELNHSDPAHREILSVERRVFNPRDLKDYVALVRQSRPGAEGDGELLPWADGKSHDDTSVGGAS